MASKMILKQSSIILENYNLGDSPRLEYIFSLYDDMYHMRFFKGIEYNDDNKTLIIPRGLDISYLENLFSIPASKDFNYDPYDRFESPKIKFLPRDDVQKRAIAFFHGVKDYAYTSRYSQLGMNLSPGKGKTYCTIMGACLERMRTIVIMKSEKLVNQWKGDIMEYTNIEPDEIYIIQGSGSITRLLERDMSKYKFILATHSTIKSYAEKNGWESITELFKYMKVGIKMYDEAHENFDNICKIDFYTNTYKTVYITGTPMRSDEEENSIYQLYFKNVPKIDLYNQDEDPHTDYICIEYNTHPTALEVDACRTPKGFSSNLYAKYVLKKDNFWRMLKIVIDFAESNNSKNIIFIASINSIEAVYSWIYKHYPELRGDIGMFHSKMDKSIKDQQLDKRIILSTTKSLGTGIDIKHLKSTNNIAEPFKSQVLARQSLERTRDDNTYCIDCVDIGFASIRRFSSEKRSIYEKFAKSYEKYRMSDEELIAKCKEIDDKRKMMYGVYWTMLDPIYFTEGPFNVVRFSNPKKIDPIKIDI